VSNRLQDKHIVITGASAGIGALLATELAPCDVKLTLAARRHERLEEVAEQVRSAGSTAVVVEADVTRREAVFRLAEAARAAHGEIDIWISNAGAGMRHRVLEATEEDMLWLYRLNCLSSLWGYQAVVPGWLESGRGGQVVDINSVGGKAGFKLGGGYCAAKHAMDGLAQVLRQELLGRGIHITTVYPGLTESEFHSSLVSRTEAKSPTQQARRGNWLIRRIARKQSTEHVVGCIIRALEKPVPQVFPHRWGAFGALLFNLLPGKVLAAMERSLPESAGHEDDTG
jgi:short-subunit dehydrogenase